MRLIESEHRSTPWKCDFRGAEICWSGLGKTAVTFAYELRFCSTTCQIEANEKLVSKKISALLARPKSAWKIEFQEVLSSPVERLTHYCINDMRVNMRSHVM